MFTIKETRYNIKKNKDKIKKYMDDIEYFTIPWLERLASDANIFTLAEFILEYWDDLDFLNEDYTRTYIVYHMQYIA